ncbi:jun-like transcription factor [Elasticomyces elasticus]|nr:jun-like transcription factor [Elasticomyces elasticus]
MAEPNAPIPATLWSAHSTSTPPPDLRDVLSQLGHTLSQLNYTKTLAALLKEAEKKGDAAPQAEEWGKSIEVDRAVDVLAMWAVWREKNNGKLPTLRINAAKQKRKEKEAREKEEGKSTLVPTPHAEESSSEESSSESDEDEEMIDKAAAESDSEDSSSDASSSSEDSSDDEEEVADAKVGAKRKRVLTPESESESSSSEDSSSSSSESEDDAPPAKRAKTVETEADSSSDSSSSDSDDEDAGVAVPPTTPAAKAAASASSSSSSSASSSSEDSSSSSESESEAPPPPPPSAKKPKKAKKTVPAAPTPKDSSDAASAASSTTLPNSPTKPAMTTLDHDELLVSVPALNALDANLNPPTDPSAPHSSTSETGGVMHPDRLKRLHPNDDGSEATGRGGPKSFVRLPATEENVKKMKKGNVPFSRVPKDTVVDEKFKSNEYVSYEYADRAYQDLSVTKGKGFTKEKNKKKRGESNIAFVRVSERVLGNRTVPNQTKAAVKKVPGKSEVLAKVQAETTAWEDKKRMERIARTAEKVAMVRARGRRQKEGPQYTAAGKRKKVNLRLAKLERSRKYAKSNGYVAPAIPWVRPKRRQ